MPTKQRNDSGFGDRASSPTSVPTFFAVYATNFNFVWSSARYLGVHESDVDDVVQETFIVVHARLRTLANPGLLRSWIYGIVRRVASSHHRMKQMSRVKHRLWGFEAELGRAEVPLPSRAIEESEQRDSLLCLLNELDTEKREVFVLMELEDMSAPEVAVAIGVPLNTVYSRIRAARQEIESVLNRYRARTRFGTPCSSESVLSSNFDSLDTHGQPGH